MRRFILDEQVAVAIEGRTDCMLHMLTAKGTSADNAVGECFSMLAAGSDTTANTLGARPPFFFCFFFFFFAADMITLSRLSECIDQKKKILTRPDISVRAALFGGQPEGTRRTSRRSRRRSGARRKFWAFAVECQ
jgi:hypothetical protein